MIFKFSSQIGNDPFASDDNVICFNGTISNVFFSKDIKFKDLGLLIIDEEQRFGVEHKERIKEMKNGIDVLTLSATPIPRTLQMSLVGIRQLSQLETPPMNRYSVQTYVVGHSIATCLLSLTALKEAMTDTSVLPKPTSPHTSRSIGLSLSISFLISSTAFF